MIHWRSSQKGPLLAQVLESLAPLNLTEQKMRDLFNLGSLYDQAGRLKNWQWLAEEQPASTYVRIHTEPRRYSLDQIDWKSRILSENDDFLVFNKPSQIPCHPMVDNSQENILVGLEKSRGEKLFLTHRLDIATEGLLLFAKTSEFQSLFNLLLVERKVHKKYFALVEGTPLWSPGTELLHYMLPSPRAPKKVVQENLPGTQECRLRVCAISESSLKIELLTGRTHQIRAQLSFEGFPILGDTAYGAHSQPWGPESIALQSYELSFVDPRSNKDWDFQVPNFEQNWVKLKTT